MTGDPPEGRSTPYGAADDAAWGFPLTPDLPSSTDDGRRRMTTLDDQTTADVRTERDAALAEHDRVLAEHGVNAAVMREALARADQLDGEVRVLRTQVAALEISRRRWRDRMLRRAQRVRQLEAVLQRQAAERSELRAQLTDLRTIAVEVLNADDLGPTPERMRGPLLRLAELLED